MKVLAVIIIILFVMGIILYYKLKKVSKRWANTFFGTDSFAEGFKAQEQHLASTPKSVSSMTEMYLPLIQKDFPAFNLFEFTQKAENMLLSVFNAVESKNVQSVVNASEDLKYQVQGYIEDLNSQGITEIYDNVKIHKTAITHYQKEAGTCIVVFQTALEYYKYRLKEGKVIKGRKDLKVQTKYNISLVYIQDTSKLKEAGYKGAVGVSCPNCGAPVTNLGHKSCEYCGSGIREINIHTWFLNKYEEL